MTVRSGQQTVGKPSLERSLGTGDIEPIDMAAVSNVRLIYPCNDPSVISRTPDQPRNDAAYAKTDEVTTDDRGEEEPIDQLLERPGTTIEGRKS